MSRIWFESPPPHIGWWNASFIVSKNEDSFRWWDGEMWSEFVIGRKGHSHTWGRAGEKAKSKMGKHNNSRIVWTTYWPENARVKRIAP